MFVSVRVFVRETPPQHSYIEGRSIKIIGVLSEVKRVPAFYGNKSSAAFMPVNFKNNIRLTFVFILN